jgi:hypothetical protein
MQLLPYLLKPTAQLRRYGCGAAAEVSADFS